MEELIIHLLNQTRSADNELINSAEKQLTELATTSADFVPSLVSISSNAGIPEITLLSAIIHLQFVVNHLWRTGFTPEIKDIIKNSLPNLIMGWPNGYQRFMSHYVHTVVSKAVSNESLEWPEIVNLIYNLLSQGQENQCKCGLIIANALCGSIGRINEGNSAFRDFAINFGVTLSNILNALFTQCDDYVILSYGFHCASRLFKSDAGFDFFALSSNFNNLVVKSINIVNFNDTPEYNSFANNALKFSYQYLMKYGAVLPPEVYQQYFNAIMTLLPANVSYKMKCDLLKLLKEIFNNPSAFSFISENIMEFLFNIILPLYGLTSDNMHSLSNDPVEFEYEVRKNDDSFEDIRSGASTLLKFLAVDEEHYEIVTACMDIASNAYTNFVNASIFSNSRAIEEQIVLFAAFQMFSSVSAYMKDIDKTAYKKFFVNVISPLFDHQEELVRSAAFMLLSESTNVESQELIMKCIEHISDPFPLARYYAALSASGLIDKSLDVWEIKRSLGKSDFIPNMFKSLFELSGPFRFPNMAKAVYGLLRVFNRQLLPFATDIFNGLMMFLSNSADILETAQNIVCDSLTFLIDLVVSNDLAREQLAPMFCFECFNALGSIQSDDAFDLLLSATVKLFELVPFQPGMRSAVNLIVCKIRSSEGISITEPVELISLFVIKDTSFGTSEISSVVIPFCVEQMTQRMADFHAWCEFAQLACNILMRLNADSNQAAIRQIVAPLAMMSMEHIEKLEFYYFSSSIAKLVSLVNSLLFVALDDVSRVLADKFVPFINFWIDKPTFPESQNTFIHRFDFFAANNELLMRALISSASGIFLNEAVPMDEFEENYDFSSFDFSEYEELEKSCVWFSFAGTLIDFMNLLNRINGQFPEIHQLFLQQIPQEWTQKFKEIPAFALKFNQRKMGH